MNLFDRINAILRSRMAQEPPVHNVIDEQIMGAEVFPQSQAEEAQARFGVPQEELDEVQLLKRKIIEDLLQNQGTAQDELPQTVKGS